MQKLILVIKEENTGDSGYPRINFTLTLLDADGEILKADNGEPILEANYITAGADKTLNRYFAENTNTAITYVTDSEELPEHQFRVLRLAALVIDYYNTGFDEGHMTRRANFSVDGKSFRNFSELNAYLAAEQVGINRVVVTELPDHDEGEDVQDDIFRDDVPRDDDNNDLEPKA